MYNQMNYEELIIRHLRSENKELKQQIEHLEDKVEDLKGKIDYINF